VLVFPFDASTQDTIAPTVTISPENGAANVDRSGIVTINFNESVRKLNDQDIDAAAINTIVRYENSSGGSIPFNASINSAKTRITVVPTVALAENELHTVTVNPLIEDLSNNIIAGSSVTFRTEREDSALPPTDVTGFAINASSGRITWTPGANADSTTIEYSLNPSFSPSTSLANQSSPVDIGGLPANQQVYYRVRSVKGGVMSGWVTGVFTTQSMVLPAPNNVTATPGAGKFIINFSEVQGKSDYALRRTTTPGNYSNSPIETASSPPITTGTLEPGIWYYQVAARVSGGIQTWSNEQSVTVTQSDTLPAPDTVSATTTQNGASISFSAVTGATDYSVRWTRNAGNYSGASSKAGNSSPITLTGLLAGTQYFYQVSSRKNGVTQAWSAERTFTTQPAVSLPTIKGLFGWPVPNTQADLDALTLSQDTGVSQGNNIALTINRTTPGVTDFILVHSSKTITAMTAAGLPALENFTSKVIGTTRVYYLSGASQGPAVTTNFVITVQ
jgi:hypothetical protein